MLREHGGEQGLVADLFCRRFICRLRAAGRGARKRRAAQLTSTVHYHGSRGRATQTDRPVKTAASPWLERTSMALPAS
jgi:hypothetical protein